MNAMATFRVSEADAARDIAGLMARALAGEEVVIDSATPGVAVRLAPVLPGRTIEEILARMPDDDSMRMGGDFADDVETGIASLTNQI